MGRLNRRLAVALLLSAQVLAATAGQVLGFTGFGTATADATYGQQMTFRVALTGGAPAKMELLLRFAGSEATLVAPVEASGSQASYVWDAAQRYVTPNTRIVYQWRATDGGNVSLSPEQTLLYDDDRAGLDWQAAVIGDATVHWYGGAEQTARRFGELTADGAARAEALLGHQMNGPVDIFVYDAREDFFGALGPGAREWFGAATFPQIRTVFMWLGAGSNDYLETTIVHEVTHVVFHDATANPFHEPAKWLNEGLATWSERRSAEDQRATVEFEAHGGGLFAFDAIAYDFPFGTRGSSLSYAMGTTMIDMIIGQYGDAAMARMAAAYRGGASDEDALEAGTGVPAERLFNDFYASFGVDAPQPVAPAPLLPSNVRKPGGPGATDGGTVPSAPASPAQGEPGGLGWVLVVAALILVVVVGFATWAARRRVSRREPR
ncbi:MAG: peptidase MA family metallohydrolase [Chloroflexota bacterium]